MICQIRNRCSKGPKTLVLTGVPTLAIPPKVRLGIKLAVLAEGYSIGVLMPDAARLAASPSGEILTPPRPTPKTNSFTQVGPKLLVSEMLGTLPGPFLRSVMVSGQFQEPVVVP